MHRKVLSQKIQTAYGVMGDTDVNKIIAFSNVSGIKEV